MINKEEREAIEKLKEYALCNFGENGEIETYANSYKWILLNLVDKQENRIKELEADKETLTKEYNYYKERYNEFNNAFVKGGNKR